MSGREELIEAFLWHLCESRRANCNDPPRPGEVSRRDSVCNASYFCDHVTKGRRPPVPEVGLSVNVDQPRNFLRLKLESALLEGPDDEPIEALLREQEVGGNTADCRPHGISTATFYSWKAKYGGMS